MASRARGKKLRRGGGDPNGFLISSCIKVKRFLADNGVTIPERNISTDAEAEQTLIAVGGKRQVPCLFIDGKPLYESSDIIAWAKGNLL